MMTRKRIPPGQKVTLKFPVLHEGEMPELDEKNWRLEIEGEVEAPLSISLKDLKKLPTQTIVSDFHCVTGWSKLDIKWGGVRFSKIVEIAKPGSEAKFVTIIAEGGYATSLTLEEMLEEDVLLAYSLDNRDLAREHGGPLRLVVPKKYAYKSVKWVRNIVFTKEKELGYWEKRGYSDSADPWKEERYA